MRKSSIMIAVMFAFTMMATGMVAQASDQGEVEVNINVQPFVEVEVKDPAINWDVAGTADSDTDMGFHSGNPAEFEVRANAQHTLTITSSNGTWHATNLLPSPYDTYEQVKYINTDVGDDSYIGGTLYLLDGTSGTYWDGDTGQIVKSGLSSGIKTWSIAAGGQPQLYGNPENSGGLEGELAPEGTYQTDAVITASVD